MITSEALFIEGLNHFFTHLFTCPELPPTATHAHVKLLYFIAYALHHTKLHACVTKLVNCVSPTCQHDMHDPATLWETS
ncbi:hypothetical protein L208DRAFT_655024 [Tricholoma matsutake]|nr:hypothetical protein L208DRAFT_655024 [Tricholoma matsutake 945]